MDSKLVVEQMSGRWKVKHPDLQPLAPPGARAGALPAAGHLHLDPARAQHARRPAGQRGDGRAQRRAGPGRSPQWTASRPTQRRGSAGERRPARRRRCCCCGTARPSIRSTCGSRDATTPRSPRPAGTRPRRRPRGWRRTTGSTPWSARRCGGRTRPPSWSRRSSGPTRSRTRSRRTDFGDWEGLTFAEVRERWPSQLDAWLGSPDVAPPGGESITDVTRRVRRARDRLLAAHPGGTILVVSHVTPIKILLRIGLDAPTATLFRLHLDIASLSTVDWYADGPASVRLVNDTSHLS